MENTANRITEIEEKDWDAAVAEVSKRLDSGEDLTVLYAAWTNELEHIVKEECDPTYLSKLRTKALYLSWYLASEYMEEHGWKLNDNGRYVRAKENIET